MNWLGLAICAVVSIAIDGAFKTALRRAAAADDLAKVALVRRVRAAGGCAFWVLIGVWLYFRPADGGSWRWALWLAIVAIVVLSAKEFRYSFSFAANREYVEKLKA